MTWRLRCAGPRDAKAIAAAATGALHDKLVTRPASIKDFTSFLDASDQPKVSSEVAGCLLPLHTEHVNNTSPHVMVLNS